MIGAGFPNIAWEQASISSNTTLVSVGERVAPDLRDISYLLWPRITRNYWTGSWDMVRQERSRALLATIDEFGHLQKNWDGYGAEPISDQVCQNARRFIQVLTRLPAGIPVPEVMPKSGGTMGFEWDVGTAEAYLEIGNTKFSGYVKSEDHEAILIEGRAGEFDERIVMLIQEALFPPATVSNTINLIEVGEPASVRLAA